MRFLPRRRRDADLDARLADARESAEAAGAEAGKSRQRHESVQRHVVRPLELAADRNQFAAMLRASLINGHDGSGGR